MDAEPLEIMETGLSTKGSRAAKGAALEGEEETPTPSSIKPKTTARFARVLPTVKGVEPDPISEAEAETIITPAPPKSKGRKLKASEESVAPVSRLPRAARTLRTPLMESTTTIGEEQEVEVSLVASTDKKTPAPSRVKAVRSTTGSSGARSKGSSATTSSSSARRTKGVDENTAPAVVEPAARVTRTKGRK
jgi:hypothetical protein